MRCSKVIVYMHLQINTYNTVILYMCVCTLLFAQLNFTLYIALKLLKNFICKISLSENKAEYQKYNEELFQIHF